MQELRKRASEEFENSVRKTCNIDFVIQNAMIILPYNMHVYTISSSVQTCENRTIIGILRRPWIVTKAALKRMISRTVAVLFEVKQLERIVLGGCSSS